MKFSVLLILAISLIGTLTACGGAGSNRAATRDKYCFNDNKKSTYEPIPISVKVSKDIRKVEFNTAQKFIEEDPDYEIVDNANGNGFITLKPKADADPKKKSLKYTVAPGQYVYHSARIYRTEYLPERSNKKVKYRRIDVQHSLEKNKNGEEIDEFNTICVSSMPRKGDVSVDSLEAITAFSVSEDGKISTDEAKRFSLGFVDKMLVRTVENSQHSNQAPKEFYADNFDYNLYYMNYSSGQPGYELRTLLEEGNVRFYIAVRYKLAESEESEEEQP